LFEGQETVSITQIINSKDEIRNKFILEVAKKTKAEEMEALKENNVDIIIDLYGCEGLLLNNFEDKFYEAKLYNIYNMNNHFLLKCKCCHLIYTNWKFQ